MKNYQLFITVVAFFALGFIFGMVVQQGLIQGTLIKFGSSLEGVKLNLEVDFNETLIVDRFYYNLDKHGLLNSTELTDEEIIDALVEVDE